jgi:hypothetical protein
MKTERSDAYNFDKKQTEIILKRIENKIKKALRINTIREQKSIELSKKYRTTPL